MTKTELTNDSFYTSLQEQFSSSIISKEEPFGLVTIEVDSKKILNIIKWVK